MLTVTLNKITVCLNKSESDNYYLLTIYISVYLAINIYIYYAKLRTSRLTKQTKMYLNYKFS